MKPTMPAPVFTQNAQEALNLLQKAEMTNVPIKVTPKGNIKILHQKPNDRSASKQAIVGAVLDKMQAEAEVINTELRGRNILGNLRERMPSLNKFAVSGQLGNLREEWQAVRQDLDQPAQLEQQAFMRSHQKSQERVQIANEIAQLLPIGLKLSIEDDIASTFEHVFSKSAQEKILAFARDAINDRIDAASGFTVQTEKDLSRQYMNFIVEQRATPVPGKYAENNNEKIINATKKEFLTGYYKEKISALFELAGQNKVVAFTLSALTNQDFLKVMGMYFDLEVPTLSGDRAITAQSLDSEEIISYTVRRKPDGDIELSFLRLREAIKLISMDGQQEWKINSSAEFNGPLSEENFGEKQMAKILLKKSDLEQGILNPTFVERPIQSFRICPDYADIQLRAQRRNAIPQRQ